MGERLLCKQEVIGSIPIGSTNHRMTGFIQTTEINSFAIGNGDEFDIVKAG